MHAVMSLIQEQQGLEGNFNANGAWDQRPRHGPLDGEFGSPAGAVSRQKHGRVKSFQIGYGALDLGLLAHG